MKYLAIFGWVCIAVGVLGLLSQLLNWFDVSFNFYVSKWYGPFIAGAICLAVAWFAGQKKDAEPRA